MRAFKPPYMSKVMSKAVIPPSIVGQETAPPAVNPKSGPTLGGNIIPKGIILANPTAVTSTGLDPIVNRDPLDALRGPILEGMDEDENINLFLNLHKIKDIDMSMDSSKRKRCEEGEEVTSHAPKP